MQALIYDKKCDNSIRTACRQGGSAETVLESETIAQELQKIANLLSNEEAERKVTMEDCLSEPEDAGGDSAEFIAIRKAPASFTQGSGA